MAPTTPSPPESTPLCIPYDKATPHQISLALAYTMGALPDHFPTLSFAGWANILLRLKPDVWVDGDAVSIDY